MLLLHTSDLHLGRQFNGLALEGDHQAILDQIVAAILVHRPDVLIIAGDIFDRATPPASAVRQFNAFLTRVANQTSAAVVMIAGNHDSGDRIGAMSIMTDARRALIRGPLVAEETPLILNDAHGAMAFSALPFAYEYAARECFADETIATPEDVLRAQIAAARRHVPASARWVIVAHAFVAGASNSQSERPLARVGGIETINPDVFEGAHYVALGHLHRPQCVASEHIRYCGAPLAFGFDEADQVKSMTLVEIDPHGAARIQTIAFAPPRGVRVLRGKLADLVAGQRSSDFVKAVLTDETPLIDPMKRLRETYPHACYLGYAHDERAPETKSLGTAQIKINDPIDVIGDFLTHVRGEPASEVEAKLLGSALHHLQSEEDQP